MFSALPCMVWFREVLCDVRADDVILQKDELSDSDFNFHLEFRFIFHNISSSNTGDRVSVILHAPEARPALDLCVDLSTWSGRTITLKEMQALKRIQSFDGNCVLQVDFSVLWGLRNVHSRKRSITMATRPTMGYQRHKYPLQGPTELGEGKSRQMEARVSTSGVAITTLNPGSLSSRRVSSNIPCPSRESLRVRTSAKPKPSYSFYNRAWATPTLWVSPNRGSRYDKRKRAHRT